MDFNSATIFKVSLEQIGFDCTENLFLVLDKIFLVLSLKQIAFVCTKNSFSVLNHIFF